MEIADLESAKKFLKIFLSRLAGVLIPVLILMIYIFINGLWEEFISYTVLGISTFSNKIGYSMMFMWDDFWLKVLAGIAPAQVIVMIIIYLYSFKKKELDNEEWFRNLKLLLIYSLSTAVVIIPISDKAHFAVGSVCACISFVYLVHVILDNVVKKEKIRKISKIFFDTLSKFLFLLIIGYSIFLLISYIRCEDRTNNQNHFKNILIEKDYDLVMTEMGEFIKDKEAEGKKVYILDIMSATFTIPIDKYDKNYDMFNMGNFGKDGTDRNYRGH